MCMYVYLCVCIYADMSWHIYLWAELRWAARAEAVIHLDDLLLRRVRLGLVLPGGGLKEMEQIRAIVQPELGWEEMRWKEEIQNYASLWHRAYGPPATEGATTSPLFQET